MPQNLTLSLGFLDHQTIAVAAASEVEASGFAFDGALVVNGTTVDHADLGLDSSNRAYWESLGVTVGDEATVNVGFGGVFLEAV